MRSTMYPKVPNINEIYSYQSCNSRSNGRQTSQTRRSLLQTQLHGLREAYIGHTLLLAEFVHAADLRKKRTIYMYKYIQIKDHPLQCTTHQYVQAVDGQHANQYSQYNAIDIARIGKGTGHGQYAGADRGLQKVCKGLPVAIE